MALMGLLLDTVGGPACLPEAEGEGADGSVRATVGGEVRGWMLPLIHNITYIEPSLSILFHCYCSKVCLRAPP